MSKSIVSNEQACLICGTTKGLHRHHIFYGHGYRELSEKYGCWCWLCGRHHNFSAVGVHNNREADLKLKRYCQKLMEQRYGHEKFMEIFGRSYL